MLQSHDDSDSVDRERLLIYSYLKISNVGKLLVKSVDIKYNIMCQRPVSVGVGVGVVHI